MFCLKLLSIKPNSKLGCHIFSQNNALLSKSCKNLQYFKQNVVRA